MGDFDSFLVQNLKKQEASETAAVENGQDASRGDFGAYHRLLKHRKDDWVKLHAVIDKAEADQYADQVIAAAGPLPPQPALLDAGCGPGIITDSLRARLSCAAATGIDISQSAVQYGREEFPQCRFETVGIDAHTVLPGQYDVIHTREFYPFTRTGDVDVHRTYLEVFAKHLKPGGLMIHALLAQNETLADNSRLLAEDMSRWGLSPFQTIPLANAAILRRLGNIPLSRNATLAIQTILRRPQRYFYISRRIGQ
jgi:2-polyprenyl-3-methyl-5-hydroxy-6-metoxy-1,4-benzoquinol methylase